MPQPIVSIVTPAYNHSRFIGECIESVLNQSFSDWEMIVVDDGSTDGTIEAASNFKDARIKCIQLEHRGLDSLSETYNKSLQESQGEFIAILEADDLWPVDKLSIQVESMAKSSAVLSSGKTQVVDESGGEIEILAFAGLEADVLVNDPVGTALKAFLHPQRLTWCFPVSTMVRKDALTKIGGFLQFPGLPLIDLPTFSRLALEGRFHIDTDSILGIWRRHSASTTRNAFPQILEGSYAFVEQFVADHGHQIPITDAELASLDSEWRTFQAERWIWLARSLSSRGMHKVALQALRASESISTLRNQKIKTTIGKIMASMKISFEPVLKSLTGYGYEEAIQLSTGDSLVDDSMLGGEPIYRPLLRHRDHDAQSIKHS